MRILLIQPASNIMSNRKEGKPALQPMGLAYIAGTLLANGYSEVKILDVLTEGYYNETPFKDNYVRYGLSPEDIKKEIISFMPDVVGISCMMSLRKYQCYEVCALVKEVDKDIVTVVGGNHVTCFPEEALEHADFVVLGEGETPFLNLIQYLDKKRTSIDFDGIAFVAHGKPQKRYQVKLRKDLDNIPFPRHDMLALDKHLQIWKDTGYHFYEAKKFTSMTMARGCTLNCSHCPHNIVFPGFRTRTPENIVKDLGVQEIQFHEYNGLMSRPIMEKFCKLMLERYSDSIRWGFPIGVWVKALDYDLLRKMRNAGSDYINLAIESPNRELLGHLMRGKDVSKEHTLEVIRWCRDLGYYINCFFMIGLEGQNKEDIEQTIEFSSKLDIDTVSYFIAQPLPGTPFWDHCVQQNMFSPDFDTFHLRYGKSNTRIDGVTAEELEEYRHSARSAFLKYWQSQGRTPYEGIRGKNFLRKRI